MRFSGVFLPGRSPPPEDSPDAEPFGLLFSDMEEHNIKDVINNNEQLNLDLVYSYTNSSLQKCSDGIDDLNTRLTTFLGFGGLLLRFAIELADSCPSTLLFKVMTLGCATFSLCQSGYGLLAHPVGNVPKAASLMQDENFQKENQTVKASVVSTWLLAIDEIEISIEKKQKQLNRSIYFLIAAVVAFSLNALISSFFHECI